MPGCGCIDGFNTQPPEGGWGEGLLNLFGCGRFQHTAARRRLVSLVQVRLPQTRFQHTAARRRLAHPPTSSSHTYNVSTHSRPKAAGWLRLVQHRRRRGFNTQPPEGGWDELHPRTAGMQGFNTQPPEGGWGLTGGC